MVKKKHKSKRTTLKDKYKVEKKVKEHRRKLRKEYRRNPGLRRYVNKKFSRVPTTWSVYDELLNEKANEAEHKLLKQKRKEEEKEEEREIEMEQAKEEQEMAVRDGGISTLNQKIFNSYESSLQETYRQFDLVVRNSDLIFEILDARDPIGTRCKKVENQILSLYPQKKIVLVLTKMDLVPLSVGRKWLAYLRKELPTFPFQGHNFIKVKKQSGASKKKLEKTLIAGVRAPCQGTKAIVQLIKNFYEDFSKNNKKRLAQLRRSDNIIPKDKEWPWIRCGVIGFPGVGKSIFIDNITRITNSQEAITDDSLTFNINEFKLFPRAHLITLPGRIFPKNEPVQAALNGWIRKEQLRDSHMDIVEYIINNVPKRIILQVLNIADFQNAEEMVENIRLKLNNAHKPMDEVLLLVLRNWINGKFRRYTEVPDDEPTEPEFLNSWRSSLELEKLEKYHINSGLPDDTPNAFILPSTQMLPDKIYLNGTDDEEMDVDEENNESQEEAEENGEDGEDSEPEPEIVVKQPVKVSNQPKKLKKAKGDEYDFKIDFKNKK